jgi:RNA polymerase sigma factor (sigma-70 family)
MPLSQAMPSPLLRPTDLLGRPWLETARRSSLRTMAATVATSEATDATLVAEEARLAHAAAGGDGTAFATLYERYERRAYNLAYRVTGSEDDAADAVQEAFLSVMKRLPRLEGRELAFGSYLFTATRNACYDLMQRAKRAQPSDAIPESAAPIGAGAGGLGLDPGDPDEDPDRKLLLESQQEEIRAANERLPERQREALALRELEELSYDEIAAIMEMNRNSVAQLISRARINLRGELRGGALASIVAASPDCERALPLIALRDDGQLADGDGDAAWLDGHLTGCATCRLGVEAMQEAGTSYRAWAPIAAAPWLFEATMAKAAELTGSDWSEAIAEHAATRDPSAIHPGMPTPYRLLAPAVETGKRRRRFLIAGGLAAAILLAIGSTVLGDDDPPAPVEPAADTVAAPTEPDKTAKPEQKTKKKKKKQATTSEAGAPPTEESDDLPAVQTGSGGGAPNGQPEADTPAPKPRDTSPTPDPGPAPADPDPPPVVDEPPVVEEPPPAEEPPPGRDPNGPTVD